MSGFMQSIKRVCMCLGQENLNWRIEYNCFYLKFFLKSIAKISNSNTSNFFIFSIAVINNGGGGLGNGKYNIKIQYFLLRIRVG